MTYIRRYASDKQQERKTQGGAAAPDFRLKEEKLRIFSELHSLWQLIGSISEELNM
jgi:hypothetical protein